MAMHARSTRKDAPERAEGVLSRFRELCTTGVLDNRPDAYTYSLLLKTWVQSDRHDAIEQAMSCLYWMRDLYEDENDEAALPDVVKYTTILSALARKNKGVQAEALINIQTQDFLSGNQRARPDYKLFDSVIGACVGNGGTTTDAARAETILRRMQTLTDSGQLDVRPRLSTYKQVIVAYKKSNNAERADALLWEADSKLDGGGVTDKKIFQTVLNAWHESRSSDKQYHIQKIRNAMGQRFKRR